ncbi:MAG: efflux RND transporter permease subunit, partial [Pseudomonadales bacterium]
MQTAIRWFANNSVAANLLMIVLVLGGISGALTTNQEEFPNFDVKVINVFVPYLGAAPIEAEKAVCVRIEEAIEGVEGIEKVYGTAVEGGCSVASQLYSDADDISASNEIKSRIDSINNLPIETEKPNVSKVAFTRRVLQIALFGDATERELKELGRSLRDKIAAVEGISQVAVEYTRPYEISVEVSEETLRRYQLNLQQVAQAIRTGALDMPGGTLKTENGEILIRTMGQAYSGSDFSNIVVLTRLDGTRVTLGEIADIKDTFEEGDLLAAFNGAPAVMVNVSQVGSEDLIKIAADTKEIVAEFNRTLPQGIDTNIWIDTSLELEERMSVLLKNAGGGLLLVLVILALFLQFRLAMWVAIGIPVALLGTLALVPFAGLTISTMTVLAFILVLGIVVDDAIVVGERVYAHEQQGKEGMQAAVEGTWEVSVPVIFGVLTTIAAFLPLIMVDGSMANFFAPLGWVVILALICSIVESQLILPSHLAHRSRKIAESGFAGRWNKFQGRLSNALQDLGTRVYRPFLQNAISWRYATATTCLGLLILAFSLIASGRVNFGFFPAIEGNRIYASLELPEGVAAETTLKAALQMQRGAQLLNDEIVAQHNLSQPLVRNTLSSVGQKVDRNGPGEPPGPGRSNLAEIVIDILPFEERANLSAKEIANRWRELVGPIPDAVKLSFDASTFSAGAPIEFRMQGSDVEVLRNAAEELKYELTRYPGVFDVSDTFRSGKQEIQLQLLPEARNLGLTLNDLGSQVRNAFYGVEAQRIQRGQDDVRVMVRFPESERASVGDLENMYIRTPQGSQVPFYSVAQFEVSRGFSEIRRLDGRRVVEVSADVDRTMVTPESVMADIKAKLVTKLQEKYPTVVFDVGGEQEERNSSFISLGIGLLFSCLVIYGLLAIPLKSYLQPMVIMSVIPFGAVGAIVGHYVLDVQLMFFSALGIVALAGVVVNSSLVLVDYANRQRREGLDAFAAISKAAVVRFRPIILTSVTTFVGLIPLMTTTTPATGPFLPIAISLAWGVLFA